MSAIDAARDITRTTIEEIAEGQYVSNDNRDLYTTIRDMKLAKIRQYQISEAEGNVDREMASAIVSALKSDVAVCDLLIATDFDDAEDVGCTLRMIKAVVTSAPEPGFQEDYLRALSENEASMEYTFALTVNELQHRIRAAA